MARAVDGDTKVVRSTRGVTVVREHDGNADPRVEAEKLRRTIGDAIADDVTAGVAGPKPGAAGAHFALMQSELLENGTCATQLGLRDPYAGPYERVVSIAATRSSLPRA